MVFHLKRSTQQKVASNWTVYMIHEIETITLIDSNLLLKKHKTSLHGVILKGVTFSTMVKKSAKLDINFLFKEIEQSEIERSHIRVMLNSF